MRNDDPARLWNEVREALEQEKAPKEPFLKAVYDVMTGKIKNEDIEEALELIKVAEYREPIMAYFLSGATIKEMAQNLHMSEKVLRHFEKLMMDRSAFKHKLHWRRYAKQYAEACETKEGKALVESGMLMGPVAISFHLQHGNETLTTSDKELAEKLAQTSFFKGLVARGTNITSLEAREALRWAQLHMKQVAAKANIDDSDELEQDAMAAIERFVSTKTPEELGVKPGEILH